MELTLNMAVMDGIELVSKAIFFIMVCIHACHSRGNFCFDCLQQTDPFACNSVRQCGPDEKCFFSAYFLDTQPDLLWDYGCKATQFCGLIVNTTSRRGVRQAENRFKIDKCDDCCFGDFCNRLPCDDESQKKEPPGLVCHSCLGVFDPSDCKQAMRCGQGEQCAVWTTANGLTSLGCKPESDCRSEGSNLLYGKRETILEYSFASGFDPKTKRQAVADSQCRQCCNSSMCAANYCSKTNTLPPYAVTVTIPTTTPRPLQVAMVPSIVSTFETDKATFACDVSGEPPFEIEFSRSFSSNKTTTRIPSCDGQVSLPEGNKSCTILHNRLSESGSISCKVKDSLGQTASASAKLMVVQYVNNLHTVIRPHDVVLSPGSSSVLECSIRGLPEPTLEWFRNISGAHVKIDIKNSAYMVTESQDKITLKITANSGGSVDGAYYCQGANLLESIRLPFSVNTISEVVTALPLKDVSINVDTSPSTLNFSCGFESYPAPFIRWGFSTASHTNVTSLVHIKISSSRRDRITESTAAVDLKELLLYKISSLDCVGDNGVYNNRSTAAIVLLQKPHISTPAKDYTLPFGAFIRLSCTASGLPEPYYSWNFVDEFNNPLIVPGINIKDNGKIVEVLHIRHSGIFTCYASNSVGSDSVSFKLNLV